MAQAEQPDSYDDELARIDASIAELKIRDMAAAKERTQIASKIQAAQFQRDILAHANSTERRRQEQTAQPPASTPSTGLARPPPPPRRPADTAGPPPEPGPRPGTPRDRAARRRHRRRHAAGRRPAADRDRPVRRRAAPSRGRSPLPRRPRRPRSRCRTSCSALGALLLGVAAVVFAGVAVTNPFGRAAILAVATAHRAGRGARHRPARADLDRRDDRRVGLLLLPMTAVRAARQPAVGGGACPPRSSSASCFALTAVAGFVYAGVTRLSAPRYATVVAVQPVPLLLAYPMIESPAGWGWP